MSHQNNWDEEGFDAEQADIEAEAGRYAAAQLITSLLHRNEFDKSEVTFQMANMYPTTMAGLTGALADAVLFASIFISRYAATTGESPETFWQDFILKYEQRKGAKEQ